MLVFAGEKLLESMQVFNMLERQCFVVSLYAVAANKLQSRVLHSIKIQSVSRNSRSV